MIIKYSLERLDTNAGVWVPYCEIRENLDDREGILKARRTLHGRLLPGDQYRIVEYYSPQLFTVEWQDGEWVHIIGPEPKSEPKSESDNKDRLRDALTSIAFHGTDQPAASEESEVDWWRAVAYDCIRQARRALDE